MKLRKAALRAAAVAGAAGGLAEMLWVGGYSRLAESSAVDVAREITATVLPGSGDLPLAAIGGVAIHMALSIVLGLALAKLLLGYVTLQARMAAALGALAAVWALNFLVVLPALNPAFVTLLPLGVTLVSKLLFGAAMAWTLQLGVPNRR